MEETFNIVKKNHTILVTVRPDFVETVVLLSDDLYLFLAMKCNGMGVNAKAAYERTVYSDLIHSLFYEEASFLRLFASPQDLYDYKVARGVKVANNNSNGWFKTACFALSSRHPRSEILSYIDAKSDEFAKKNYLLP